MYGSRKDKDQIIEQEKALALGQLNDPTKNQDVNSAIQSYAYAARYFEHSIAKDLQVTAKRYKLLSMFFGLLTFMSIGAVLGLTPLKTVTPYLVRVDNNTGYTDLVSLVSDTKTQEQRDDEFWLSTYVRFRESYNFADSDANYNAVEVMSYSDTFGEYKNFQLSKKGYTDTLGNNRQMRVVINGVVILERKTPTNPNDTTKTAQIRITKSVVDRNGVMDASIKPASWLMTVSYDYKKPPKKREQEWINPRGFGVKSYSGVQEVGVNNG